MTNDSAASSRRPSRNEIEIDRALMARVSSGEDTAMEVLFRRHAAAARQCARRILGAEAEAEEIVQETFLQAWRQAPRYRSSRSSVRGWLLVIARSRALDRVRSRQARRRREAAEALDVVSRRPSPLSDTPKVERDLEAAERARVLTRALENLPVPQRQCIELAYFEGLSQPQIAARLSAPLGTVKSRVQLGVRKLRSELRAA